MIVDQKQLVLIWTTVLDQLNLGWGQNLWIVNFHRLLSEPFRKLYVIMVIIREHFKDTKFDSIEVPGTLNLQERWMEEYFEREEYRFVDW